MSVVNRKDLKIAWLLNSGFYYWHPMLSVLSKIYSKTKVFTATWSGFAPGFEDGFVIDYVGERKQILLSKGESLYGNNFTILPLNIISKLLNYKPDVVFSNSFGVWTIIAILFKPIGRWLVVIAYEGSSPGVDYRNSPARLFVRRQMVRQADACISNSQAGKAYLTEILGAHPDSVFAHPYEVPSPTIVNGTKPTPELEDLKPPIFLFMGNTIARKGLRFLLEACTHLHNQKIENYTLVVVGDGDKRAELEKYCQENKLTESVKWIGRVKYEDIGNYLRNADIFILPTLEDTWAVVVSEAMIAGKAILCSKFAGAAEMIEEGENGYIFDPYDVEQLALLMRQFIEHPEIIPKMGARSLELMQKYTPEKGAELLTEAVNFAFKSQREKT